MHANVSPMLHGLLAYLGSKAGMAPLRNPLYEEAEDASSVTTVQGGAWRVRVWIEDSDAAAAPTTSHDDDQRWGAARPAGPAVAVDGPMPDIPLGWEVMDEAQEKAGTAPNAYVVEGCGCIAMNGRYSL